MINYVLVGLVLFYIGVNIYVLQKINKAIYLKEERRSLHKVIIWVIPFLGALLLRGFWKKNNDQLDVMTKKDRKSTKWNSSDDWQRLTGWGGDF